MFALPAPVCKKQTGRGFGNIFGNIKRPARKSNLERDDLMKRTNLFAVLLEALVAISSAQAVTIDMVPAGLPW